MCVHQVSVCTHYERTHFFLDVQFLLMARTIKKSGVRSQCRKRCRKEVCQILLTLPHLYLDQPHDFKQCEDEIRSHSAGCVQIIATRTTRKGKRCACVWMQRLRRKKKNASDTMEITLLVVLVFAFVNAAVLQPFSTEPSHQPYS